MLTAEAMLMFMMHAAADMSKEALQELVSIVVESYLRIRDTEGFVDNLSLPTAQINSLERKSLKRALKSCDKDTKV